MKSGLVVASATGVMNAATYAFTLLCAHRLGPADYGAFAAMLGLVIVVNVVSLGLQATGARRVAAAPGDRHLIEIKVMATSVRAGIALAIVCLALSPLLATVLRLDSWAIAALLAVPAFAFAVMGGQAGILQGERRWFPLATVFGSLGLARLGIGELSDLMPDPDSPESTRHAAERVAEASDGTPMKKGLGVDVTPPGKD